MAAFTHLILTRFNLKKPGMPSPGPEWLDRRFDLFETFCYPSVRAQSNQRFKWLVFFDIDTPEPYRAMIEKYARWPRFVPIYTGCETFMGFHFPRDLRSAIIDHVDDGSAFLVTTRLDNDDAIRSDYVQMVQDRFHGQQLEAVSFVHGWLLCKGKLILIRMHSNSFASLIEKFSEDSFKTVFVRAHAMLSQICRVSNVECEDAPAWMRVIHQENQENRCKPGWRYPMSTLSDGFESCLGNASFPAESRAPLLLQNILHWCGIDSLMDARTRRAKRRKSLSFRQFTEEFYRRADSLEELRRLIRELS